MRIPLRRPAPDLVVAAGFGGNSPGAWQFGAIHGSIVPSTGGTRVAYQERDSACR
jgi:hypothetical protein